MAVTQAIRRAVRGFGRNLAGLWKFGTTPPPGRIYVTESSLDASRAHMSDGLTFAKLKALLRAGEGGVLATPLELFEDMESKDLHLAGVASIRRDLLTGLDWDVVSAAETQEEGIDKGLADDAAACVREKLGNLRTFDRAMEHLTYAIGSNLAVAELVWEADELVELLPIPSWRLTMDLNDPEHVRVMTKKQPRGVIAESPKFIVHRPRFTLGCPISKSLMHAQAPIYLLKLLAVADWAKFVEIYGMPVRWATAQPGATKEEKDEALEMLANMGAASYALFSPSITCELKESSQRGTSPHKDLVDWCERKQSVGWLGEHMSADTSGSTGTYAAASVQQDTLMGKLEDDIRRERRMVGEQIIWPLVAYAFPGLEAPLPRFKREIPDVKDLAKMVAVLAQAQQIGVKIPADWAQTTLEIPAPAEGEDVLEPSIDVMADNLVEGI